MLVGSHSSAALALLLLAAGVSACEGLVGSGAQPPGTGGGSGKIPINIDPSGTDDAGGGGAGGASDAGAGSATGGATGTGGMLPAADGGVAPDAGGAGGTPGASCPYPATAPTLEASTFKVGTIVPNLSFTKEDGSSISLAQIRCDKKKRLLFWTVGGDNCPPCVASAKSNEIPAAKELGPDGLVVMESFNGERFLVGKTPFPSFRMKTNWPADSDSILLADEPTTKPFYVVGRIKIDGIPYGFLIDLETMKILKIDPTLAFVRTQMTTTPARP